MSLLACAALDEAPDEAETRLATDQAKRCVRANPRDDAEIEHAVIGNDVEGQCTADDGACQASTECTGTVDARECDSELFIGSQAADCIARDAGIPIGLRGLTVQLTYHFARRRVTWNVTTTLSQQGSAAGGQVVVIDAVTGELLDTLGWRSTP